MAHAEQQESGDLFKGIMRGGDSAFNPLNLLKTGLSGGTADRGGGMGDRFNAVLAQASLDNGMKNNIYESMFT